MHDISIEPLDGTRYHVAVSAGATQTTHEVTVWPSDVEHYTPGGTAEELIQAAFAFLLAREPQEAILPAFEVAQIERYFPEFARAMRGRA